MKKKASDSEIKTDENELLPLINNEEIDQDKINQIEVNE